MLYYLAIFFVHKYPFLNLFKYLTFRGGAAIFTALLISLLLGERFINTLRAMQGKGQPIRKEGPESHLLTKVGKPTMGGLLILVSCFGSILLWADLCNPYVWIVCYVMVACGFLGFMDDYLKIKHQNSAGVSARYKFSAQILISLIACYMVNCCAAPEHINAIAVPFFKNVLIDAGLFYYLFVVLVITGASNAVNLTDGLDGLAIVPIMIVAGCFTLFSYLVGNVIFTNYLQLHYIAHVGEIAVVCCAIIGAGLGFLWYNAAPAQVFMGDVGSLSLGGALGIISVITKHEIVLGFAGGLFVIEAVSVILQVFSYKCYGKRIFLMAPIHHHFEKLGWPESKIVVRFWIISTIFALLALSTLKLR
jgi:phospho-N-acetylmuramoyl-pentapeptide-transferase